MAQLRLRQEVHKQVAVLLQQTKQAIQQLLSITMTQVARQVLTIVATHLYKT